MQVINVNQLYQPLQSTLDKSMVSDPVLELQKSRVYERMDNPSRVSKRLRSLSPQEANHIRRSTILPLNQNLVPTDHLWKVRGKEFSAVNIEVKEGLPIPSHMMPIQLNNRGQHITTETVYEIMPRNQSVNGFNNTRSITNLRTVYPPHHQSLVEPIYSQRSSQFHQPMNHQIIQNMPYNVFPKAASPIRVSEQSNYPLNNSLQSRTIEPLQLINKNSARNNDSRYEESHKLRSTTENPISSLGSNEYYGESEVNPKKKYKYNFFSALDEAINTKCGSCGSNEIIATKPMSSWE